MSCLKPVASALLAGSLAATAMAGPQEAAQPEDGAEGTAPQARSERERNPYLDDPRLGKKVDRVCFGSQIDGFTKTTDYTVIIEAGVNDEYLVETFSYCQNLDYANSLALDRATSCLTKSDAIIPSRSIGRLGDHGGITQRCLIRDIYEWNPDAVAEDEAAGDAETEGRASTPDGSGAPR